MKVLFLTNIPSPYRVDFFNELGKKCELTVLFESDSAKSRDPAWRASAFIGFNAIFMKGIKTGEAEAFCPEVVKYLSKKRFDIIVVGMYSSPTGMLAIEYMKLRGIPFILSSDGGMKKADSGIKHWIKEHFIGSASYWLSTGKTTSEYLEYYGAKSERIFCYPFTSVRNKDILSAEDINSEKDYIYRKLNIKEKKVVLSVGQFIHRKGYDMLLRKCKGMDKDIGLYIVGGKATNEYIEIQKECNLSNVHFIDFMSKDKLAEFYKAADLFILPTREDIWGLVINEALSYGLPVITTDKCVAGIEMIREGHNGFVVPVDSDWKKHIEDFFVNTNVDKMRVNCLEIAKEYSIENMATVHINIFNAIGGGIK